MIDYSLIDYIKGEFRMGWRAGKEYNPGARQPWVLNPGSTLPSYGPRPITSSFTASVSSSARTIIPSLYVPVTTKWGHVSEVFRAAQSEQPWI